MLRGAFSGWASMPCPSPAPAASHRALGKAKQKEEGCISMGAAHKGRAQAARPRPIRGCLWILQEQLWTQQASHVLGCRHPNPHTHCFPRAGPLLPGPNPFMQLQPVGRGEKPQQDAPCQARCSVELKEKGGNAQRRTWEKSPGRKGVTTPQSTFQCSQGACPLPGCKVTSNDPSPSPRPPSKAQLSRAFMAPSP